MNLSIFAIQVIAMFVIPICLASYLFWEIIMIGHGVAGVVIGYIVVLGSGLIVNISKDYFTEDKFIVTGIIFNVIILIFSVSIYKFFKTQKS